MNAASGPVHDEPLLERVRTLLPAGHTVREVPMFGGVSIMLDERMLVAIRRDGALLVRVDPARGAELLDVDGAAPAFMGAHRPMGPGWITVPSAGVTSAERLDFWLQVALGHHHGHTGSRPTV